MNDAINNYIQNYQSFESISFNVSIVLTSIIIIAFIVGFICMFFDLELGKGILAGDASFGIMIAVIYVLLSFFNPITLGPEVFAKDAIKYYYPISELVPHFKSLGFRCKQNRITKTITISW